MPAGDFFVALLAAGSLYWRRSRPPLVLTGVIRATTLAVAFGLSDISGIAVVAVYWVGRYVDDDLTAYVGASCGAMLLVLSRLVGGYPVDGIWAGLFATLLAFFVGTRLRLRRIRSQELEREKVSQRRAAVVEE